MPGWDGLIQVNILGGAPAVNRRVFGIPLHLTADQTFASATVKSYSSAAEAAADSELGTTAKAAVAAAFGVSPRPPMVKVGKATAGYTSIDTDLDAILVADDYWFGLDLASRDEANIQTTANWAETNQRLFMAQSSDADILSATAGNVAEDLQTAAYAYTGILYHATDAKHAVMTWLSKKLAVDPDVQTTTWSKASLPGVEMDKLTTTQHGNCVSQNCNTYEIFFGLPATGPGKTSDGAWIDTLISKEWFKARTIERIAQYLSDTSNRGQKVPYSNKGLQTIAGLIRSVAKRGAPKGEGGAGHFKRFSTGELIRMHVPQIKDVPAQDIIDREVNISAEVLLAGAAESVVLNVSVYEAETE